MESSMISSWNKVEYRICKHFSVFICYRSSVVELSTRISNSVYTNDGRIDSFIDCPHATYYGIREVGSRLYFRIFSYLFSSHYVLLIRNYIHLGGRHFVVTYGKNSFAFSLVLSLSLCRKLVVFLFIFIAWFDAR
jgi:hypothetical protein